MSRDSVTKEETKMSQLEWTRTELGPADLGAGTAVLQLFEGKKQINLDTFVREDLQNRVADYLRSIGEPGE